MPAAISRQQIVEGLQTLGLEGRPVCVHSSLSSFTRVDGGADAVVDAVLAVCGTILVPSFSWSFAVEPPTDERYPNNGCDYDAYTEPTSGVGRIYTPDETTIDAKMGAVPRAVVMRPDRCRGFHAVCSFSAIGPLADALVSRQRPDDVFAPLSALIAHGGHVVMMGVDLNKLTLLHLAEQEAGREPFRRWALDCTGEPRSHAAGGCSTGFGKLTPVLDPIRRTTTVGTSAWSSVPAGEAVVLAAAAIRRNPEITHCGDPACMRCNDAVHGGPRIFDRG